MTDVDEFIAAKLMQWERVAATQPGLQLVRSGYLGSSFMLIKSTEQFYEGVLIGQMANNQMTVEQKGPRRYQRRLREEEKAAGLQAVDLTDAQIDEVLGLWSKDKSALTLGFVACAWGKDGKAKS